MSKDGLKQLALRHRALLFVLAGYSLLWALVAGRGSRWATLSVDCVAGAVGETMLGEPAWGPWSVIDGLVGGQVIYATAALPWYLVLGTEGGLAGKLAAWTISVTLVVLVYALGTRAAGRPAGVLAAMGVAFAPPMVFASSMLTGNWHWSELPFEYGVALAGLGVAWPRERAPDRPTPHLGLGLLAALSGLAIFNSPQSIPFVGLVWGAVALGCGLRRSLLGLPATLAGAAVGLAVPIWRALHLRRATDGPAGDPLWRRLVDFSPDWTKLGDLVYPELPVTLHVREALPSLDPSITGGLETGWVVACWLGCLATVAAVVERWRRGQDDRGALVASLLPVGFALAFVAAYLVLRVRIRIADPIFSEFRQASHRIIPPLLVAMAVGAAPGWVWLHRRACALSRRPVRLALGTLVIGAALVAPAVGLLSQAGLVADAPGRGDAGLAVYRGSCFDAPGFFLVGHRGDREFAEERCASLSTPARRDDCLAGLAMGLGFNAARLQGPGEWPDSAGEEPCSHAPPDFARRCSQWDPAHSPNLGDELEEVCHSLPEERRAICFLGGGWYASQVVWSSDLWPLDACESLVEERDREACWQGPGFQLGDHLSPTPERIALLLQRAPAHRRAAVARGVGYIQGLEWAARHIAVDLCERFEPDLAEACLEGVRIGREQAHPD